MASDPKTFGFGRNWQAFLEYVNEERITKAMESICSFMGVADLQGMTVLDIGSGSGLFSLAAHRLGARRVVSFDVDPDSVACATHLREREGAPETWEVMYGSALDQDFMSQFRDFDLVYSWGVLHHTGDMWSAIRNAMGPVAPNGWFYIAIYHRYDGPFGSAWWLRIKKLYNSSAFWRFIFESYYRLKYFFAKVLRFKNPFMRGDRSISTERGMALSTDLSDWLGGYPYEYANVEEIFRFVREQDPTMALENVKCASKLANNWFVFKRGARTWGSEA